MGALWVCAILILGLLVICTLSRTATDSSLYGQFGAMSIQSLVGALLRDARLSKTSSQQDRSSSFALTHAVEARVTAQIAKRLADVPGLRAESEAAMELAAEAQAMEDDCLRELEDKGS